MNLKTGMIGIFSVLAPGALLAEPIDVEVGGEYHFSLTHTDDGLNSDAAQTKETDFGVKAAKFSLRGKLSEQLTWNVLFQADKSSLERYWVTNRVSDEFDVSIGVQKIRSYGWHRRLSSSINPVRAAYLQYNPFADAMAIDFAYKLGSHALALSLVKDYSDKVSATCQANGVGCTTWNAPDVQKQPAILIEWAGTYGAIQPLIQYSSYDRGKSASASVGLRFKTDVVDSYVDYTLDTRKAKGLNPVTTAPEEQEKKISGLVVYGDFKAGQLTPYLLFSTMNVDDYTAAGAPEPDTNKDGAVNDNEQQIAVGTYFENWGAAYRPYVGVAHVSGEYVKDAATATKEDRARVDLMVGLSGKF